MISQTPHTETLQVKMARFDALPAPVRDVINGAAFEFHPGSAEILLKRGASAARCAARLAKSDKGLCARHGGV